jgi:hypothetical protein
MVCDTVYLCCPQAFHCLPMFLLLFLLNCYHQLHLSQWFQYSVLHGVPPPRWCWCCKDWALCTIDRCMAQQPIWRLCILCVIVWIRRMMCAQGHSAIHVLVVVGRMELHRIISANWFTVTALHASVACWCCKRLALLVHVDCLHLLQQLLLIGAVGTLLA